MNKPKLSSSVSVVKISDSILEFFLTNRRSQVRIKVENDNILNIILQLDGSKTIEELSKANNVDKDQLIKLLMFLEQKGILDVVEDISKFEEYNKFRRVIRFLSEYSISESSLIDMWSNIRKSHVVIIGLGAVGTWVTINLIQSGVKNITIIDPDRVEDSNLHRQMGYFENSIGLYKADALESFIKGMTLNVNINKYYEVMDKNSSFWNTIDDVDLIINCADKPTVDQTSLIVGQFCMEHNIPHIIGGGYNLHLSLLGQTIIPFKSACVNCFKKSLEEENNIDTHNIKKLQVKNRKIGSFGPACSIIASFIGMEAIKVLSRSIAPANLNRRGEFNIYTMDIKYKTYNQRSDCEWCGENGHYKN